MRFEVVCGLVEERVYNRVQLFEELKLCHDSN